MLVLQLSIGINAKFQSFHLIIYQARNFYSVINMDEQSSYTPSRQEQHSSNIVNESADDKRLNQHFFFEQNPAHSPTQPMFGLQSPSPFKKQIIVEIHGDSDEQNRYQNKEIKEIALFELQEGDNWEFREEEIQGYEGLSGMKKLREGKNTQKGLKKLSKHVLQIILRLKTATYKEIAKQLLKDFNRRPSMSQTLQQIYAVDSRTQQNIRRRVYDALNVLVAIDLLRKNGKKVVYEPIQKIQLKEKSDSIQSSDEKNDPNKLKNLLDQKQKVLEEKKKKANFLQNHIRMLEKFTRKKQAKAVQRSAKIAFPAISITYDNKLADGLIIKKHLQKYCVKVKKMHKLEGDIDIIHRLNSAEKGEKIEKENKGSRKVIYEF